MAVSNTFYSRDGDSVYIDIDHDGLADFTLGSDDPITIDIKPVGGISETYPSTLIRTAKIQLLCTFPFQFYEAIQANAIVYIYKGGVVIFAGNIVQTGYSEPIKAAPFSIEIFCADFSQDLNAGDGNVLYTGLDADTIKVLQWATNYAAAVDYTTYNALVSMDAIRARFRSVKFKTDREILDVLNHTLLCTYYYNYTVGGNSRKFFFHNYKNYGSATRELVALDEASLTIEPKAKDIVTAYIKSDEKYSLLRDNSARFDSSLTDGNGSTFTSRGFLVRYTGAKLMLEFMCGEYYIQNATNAVASTTPTVKLLIECNDGTTYLTYHFDTDIWDTNVGSPDYWQLTDITEGKRFVREITDITALNTNYNWTFTVYVKYYNFKQPTYNTYLKNSFCDLYSNNFYETTQDFKNAYRKPSFFERYLALNPTLVTTNFVYNRWIKKKPTNTITPRAGQAESNSVTTSVNSVSGNYQIIEHEVRFDNLSGVNSALESTYQLINSKQYILEDVNGVMGGVLFSKAAIDIMKQQYTNEQIFIDGTFECDSTVYVQPLEPFLFDWQHPDGTKLLIGLIEGSISVKNNWIKGRFLKRIVNTTLV